MTTTYTETGSGQPILLLHGGGGPRTVAAFAEALAAARPAHVVTPVHPGFNGTPRPKGLDDIPGLARHYVDLLDELDLSGVTVIGNSIGGWIAAEMAIAGSSRVAGYVIVDAVGLEVADHPVADFFSLTMPQVAELSYYEPEKFAIDVATLPPPAQAAMAANRSTLELYAGGTMQDSTLAGRLASVDARTLVVWGEADRIADPVYGAAYAAAIPGACFEQLPHTGHLPQLETPDAVIDLVWPFVETAAA